MSMKISIIVEGRTETAFKEALTAFLRSRISRMPKLDFLPQDGRVPKAGKLRCLVRNLLQGGSDHVIALTDVYTGTHDFIDAADARAKMRQWVGNEPRFHPHAAQHDFEAWLLPYWTTIQKLALHDKAAPQGQPETIDHGNPPACHIKEIFEAGKRKKSYVKPRDAKAILRGNDLLIAIGQCPELKAFVNTLLVLSGGQAIP